MTAGRPPVPAHFNRLLGYLDQDPGNLGLLSDTALAAFDAGQLEQCEALLARYEAAATLPATLVHLHGLLSMSRGDFEGALSRFESLGDLRSEPGVHYNVAYAHAMCGRYETAAALGTPILDLLPEAVTLKLRALHALGKLDDAVNFGQTHVDRENAPTALAGAFATLLFDKGDLAAARHYATIAADTPDGLVVLSLGALDAGDIHRARHLAQQALERNPLEARATLTLGLRLFAEHQFESAARGTFGFLGHRGLGLVARRPNDNRSREI